MKRSRLVLLSLLVAAVALLIPATAANAADDNTPTVTKTFSIKKSDGTAYPNVIVGIVKWISADSYDNQTPVVVQTTVTNSLGIATISVKEGEWFDNAFVEPAAGDFTHAISELGRGFSGQANETFTLKLKPANMVVNITKMNGADAAAGSSITYPGTGNLGQDRTYRTIVRSGAFGIDLSTGLRSICKYDIYIDGNNSFGDFGRQYGLQVNTSGISVTPTIFDNTLCVNQVQPLVAGSQNIFNLKLSGPNVNGTLLNADGSELSLLNGVKANVMVVRAKADGTLNYGDWGYSSKVGSNGDFSAMLPDPEAGKYFARFIVTGSKSIPSFVGSSFWVNDQGQFSIDKEGPFKAASEFSLTTLLPADAPNFVVEALKTDSDSPEPSEFSLSKSDNSCEEGECWSWYGQGRAPNGTSSYALEDGNYDFQSYAIDLNSQAQHFSIVVQGGIVTMQRDNGAIVSPSTDGTFSIHTIQANLHIKITSPIDDNVFFREGWAVIYKNTSDGEDYVTESWSVGGITHINVGDGTYELEVNPNSAGFTSKRYKLVVAGASISITELNGTGSKSASNGIFSLHASIPKLTGKLVGPNGAAINTSAGWLNVGLQKFVNGEDFWNGIDNSNIDENGNFGFQIKETGTFRIKVDVQGRTDVSELETSQFVITDVTARMDLGLIQLKAPLATFKVRLQDGAMDLIGFDFSVRKEGNWISSGWSYNGSQGSIAELPVGTYELYVNKPWSAESTIAASKSYELIISQAAGGSLTASITGANIDNGSFVLYLGLPNIIGRVVDPLGNDLNFQSGGYVNVQTELFDEVSGSWQFDRNEYEGDEGSDQIDQDGSFGIKQAINGRYRLKLLTSGFTDSAGTVSQEFSVTDSTKGPSAINLGEIRLEAPELKIKVREAGSTIDLKYSQIFLSKNEGYYDKNSYFSTGYKAIAVKNFDQAGTYKLTVNPSGSKKFGNLTSTPKTYTVQVSASVSRPGSFDVTVEGSTKDSSSSWILYLGTPNVVGKVVDSAGLSAGYRNNLWTYISVQKFDSIKATWFTTNYRGNTDGAGEFGITIEEPGTFRLRIQPQTWQRTDVATTYTSSFEILDSNLNTFNKNFGAIVLAGPTLRGKVLSSDGLTSVSGSEITVISAKTGQRFWSNDGYSGGFSNSSGDWSLNLPKGTYTLMARAPWRNINYGSSDEIFDVTVQDDGQVTIPGGLDPNALEIRLGLPTWSGLVKSPLGTEETLANISVCLVANMSYRNWDCSYTNDKGQWALSKPAGFSGFDSTSLLIIGGDSDRSLSENRIKGLLGVSTALGVYEPDTIYSDIVLRPLAPNTEITVTAGGKKAPYLHIEITRPDGSWITSATTNADGKVRINIPDESQPFEVTVYTDGNSTYGKTYSTTKKSYRAEDITPVDGLFSTVVALAVPNLKGIVVEPPTQDGTSTTVVRNTWVEIYNESLLTWVRGVGTDNLGQFSVLLPKPSVGVFEYRVTVNAQWDNTRMLTSRVYIARVTSANVVTIFDKKTGVQVLAVNSIFTLPLTAPNVIGYVKTPAATPLAVQDSRVTFTQDFGSYKSRSFNTYSRTNGAFGANVGDGNYILEAHSPGRSVNLAKSLKCHITVLNEAIVTGDEHCFDNGVVSLTLREPNLKFKLVDGTTPMAGAYVNLHMGYWDATSYAAEDGSVSFFIDSDEIANETSWLSGRQNFWINVDPDRYGNNQVVSWNCSSGDLKPVCKDLPSLTIGQEYTTSTIDLGTIQVLKPNTRIRILTPDSTTTAVSRGGSATLYKQENGWLRWLDYGPTDVNGFVDFFVEDSDVSSIFVLDVRSPWDYRSVMAQKRYENLSYEKLNNQDFRLASPNLKITSKDPTGVILNRWAWVGIEEVNSSYIPIRWIVGNNTDEDGQFNVLLANSKKYRITMEPGYRVPGTRTFCIVSVDVNGIVSLESGRCVGQSPIVDGELEFILSSGNVQGTVIKPNAGVLPISGAIVFAEAFQNGVAVGITREAQTNENGEFGMQLDPIYNWKMRVFYVTNPADNPQIKPVYIVSESLTTSSALSNLVGDHLTLEIRLQAK